MSDEVFRSLGWVGLAVAIVAVFMLVEVVLRSLTNRYGTPQDRRTHQVTGELPRMNK